MNVRISHKHEVVAVPAHDAVRSTFPEAKPIVLGNENFLAVDHNPATTFLLRKLGFNVPSPSMHYKYPGHKVPFEVQKQTVAHLVMNERAYVLNAMGTGKTKAALWAWDHLYSKGLTGKLIVFAPLSTLAVVWGAEVMQTLPHRSFSILHHAKRSQRLAALADRDADIYIINHDGHRTMFDELMTRMDITHLLIDELAVYRNPGADRSKSMAIYAATKKWVWGMTGSPIPTSPTDVFSQARIVTPHTVPGYFRIFREQVLLKVGTFKWVPKANAVETAFKVLQPAVRYTLNEVVELPEIVERFIDVPMGPKQAGIYKSLYDTAFALIKTGEVVTAANAGGIMSKLLQVSCGWVYATDGQVAELDNDTRIQALIDAIEGTDNKILVFANFKHSTMGIMAALKKAGYKDCVLVDGDVSATNRNHIFSAFQQTDKYRILVAHPQCLAHGITLTRADTIVWFNPTTSLEIYDQANQRIRRIGQKNKQLILKFRGSKVEAHVYNLLSRKQTVQSSFLELFAEAA